MQALAIVKGLDIVENVLPGFFMHTIVHIFGMRYHPSHVRRLLHNLGLSIDSPGIDDSG